MLLTEVHTLSRSPQFLANDLFLFPDLIQDNPLFLVIMSP